MPLPSILDVAHKYLFEDRDKMVAAGVPAVTISHILRLRDMYSYWLQFPHKRDRDIVAELRKRYRLGDSQARDDLRLIKSLLGDFQKTTKDYHRYRFIEMISAAYEKARRDGNTRDMVAAAAKYAKYMQLDKEDDRDKDYDSLALQVFKFTDDPSVIGISRVENFREKIKKKKEQYWNDTVVDIDYEDLECDIDDIFKPQLKHVAAADIS